MSFLMDFLSFKTFYLPTQLDLNLLRKTDATSVLSFIDSSNEKACRSCARRAFKGKSYVALIIALQAHSFSLVDLKSR